MLNYLWGFMILAGLGAGIVTGQVEAVSNASIDSAGEAVNMAVTMLGIMSMWTGLIEVARQAGLLDRMTRGLRPVLSFLFPRIPQEHRVNEYLTANILANILGLGWAATPAGLKAMEDLAQLEEKRRQTGYLKNVPKDTASNEMCTFLILNISSLQLIPVNMIAYRSRYGSTNPAVVGPAVLATFVSTFAAVIFCRVMDRR